MADGTTKARPNEGGRRLAAIMAERGLKQDDVQELVGASNGLVHHWLHFTRIPGRHYGEVLRRVFGIDPILWTPDTQTVSTVEAEIAAESANVEDHDTAADTLPAPPMPPPSRRSA